MWGKLLTYLRKNLIRGLLTSPFRAPLKSWALVPVFVLIAVPLGFASGLLAYDPISTDRSLLFLVGLFFGMLIAPSLTEEVLFRGLMIPRQVWSRGWLPAVWAVGISTLLYVLWHPFSALTNRPEAQAIFLDPSFLVIVALLGLACGYQYVYSKSLWGPVLIHWVTVVVWVFLFGGWRLVLG